MSGDNHILVHVQSRAVPVRSLYLYIGKRKGYSFPPPLLYLPVSLQKSMTTPLRAVLCPSLHGYTVVCCVADHTTV